MENNKSLNEKHLNEQPKGKWLKINGTLDDVPKPKDRDKK